MLWTTATFSSCLNDLDLKQPSQFTSASMWTEENDVASAVNGAYALMRDAFRNTNDFWGIFDPIYGHRDASMMQLMPVPD